MSRGRTLAGTMTLAVALAAFLALASPAWADQFRVTRTDDPPPNGCAPNDCSLREAVIAANATTAQDTIVVPRGNYVLTIAVPGENGAQTGDLDLTEDVIITGAGARSTTVTGAEGFNDRIFDVPPDVEASGDAAEVPSDVTAEISGVTITGGNVLDFGGGVRNAGALLTLRETTVSGNDSTGDGGGIRNDGTMRIVRSTVSGNESGAFGGGIANDGRFSFGPLAEVAGVGGVEGPGNLDLVNSTISGNSSVNGGGVVNFNGGEMSFLNVTLNNNSAAQGSNFSSEDVSSATSATFENTIVANAQGGGQNCANDPETIESLGNNLDDDGSCAFTQPSDIVGKNPRLGALRDNGGPTNTHALQKGSPAINAGNDATAPPTDQRGVERPQGKRSDIGAFEFKPSGNGSGGDGKGKCKGKGQGQCQNADSGNVRT